MTEFLNSPAPMWANIALVVVVSWSTSITAILIKRIIFGIPRKPHRFGVKSGDYFGPFTIDKDDRDTQWLFDMAAFKRGILTLDDFTKKWRGRMPERVVDAGTWITFGQAMKAWSKPEESLVDKRWDWKASTVWWDCLPSSLSLLPFRQFVAVTTNSAVAIDECYEKSPKFKVGDWVRRTYDGMLAQLKRQDSLGNWFGATRRNREVYLCTPSGNCFEPAVPRAGEWWQHLECPEHISELSACLSAPIEWRREYATYENEARCGCFVPVNFGKGNA